MRKLLLVLGLAASIHAFPAAAQTVVKVAGCSTPVITGTQTISCTDASAPIAGDAYIVSARVYDNHTLTLDCGGCKGAITLLPGYPFYATAFQYWMWTVANPAAGTAWKFTVTDSGMPASAVMNVMRIAGGMTVDTVAVPLTTQSVTMSTSLTTAAPDELIVGWCTLDHADPLSPGAGLLALPTSAVNSLMVYAAAPTAGKNNLVCGQRFASDNGVINTLALAPAATQPPPPPVTTASPSSFTLTVADTPMPMAGPYGISWLNLNPQHALLTWSTFVPGITIPASASASVPSVPGTTFTLTITGTNLSVPASLTVGPTSPCGYVSTQDSTGTEFYLTACLITN